MDERQLIWVGGGGGAHCPSHENKSLFMGKKKKQSFSVPRFKHISSTVKGIQSSLFSSVIAECHIVFDTN
jgi:hypothetical protein